jgi:uncharacterized protein DUF6232
MTIFYRGPCVRITHKVFETRCPAYRCFLLDGLERVRVVEWTVEPPAAVNSARIGSTSVAGATAVALALGRTDGWQAFDSPVATLAMGAVMVASVAVSGACWRVRVVERELAAVYRGARVSLHRSTDQQEFAQVKRALVRALEQLADSR